MEEGARCCDFCNSTVVLPARMSKIYGSEQNKISNPTFMTVYIRDSPDDSPSDPINYYVGEVDADIQDGSPCPLCNPEGNNDNYLVVEGTDHFGRDWAYSCDNCDFEVEMSNRPQITKIEPTGNFVYTESTDEVTSFDDMRGQHLFSADGENSEEWGNERTSAVLAGVFATALEGLMSKLNTAIDENSEIEILFFTDCIDYLCSGMASTLAENSKEMDSEIVNAIGGMLAMTALQLDKLRTNPEIEDAMNPMPEPPTDSIVDVVVEDANDFGDSLDLDMWAAENETSVLIMEQDLCPVCSGEETLELMEYPSELCFEHSEAWDDMIFDSLYAAEAFDEKVTVWYCGRCGMAHGSDQNAAEICCTAEDPYSDENWNEKKNSETRADNTRMTRAEADKLVGKVKKLVNPYVDRIEVCGSYRRGSDRPGDLDVVIIPKPGFTLPEIVKAIKPSTVNWIGDKKTQVVIDGRKVDFRVSTPEGWGAALLYFTGPAGYNIGMRRRAKKQGMKLNEYGIFDRTTNKYLGGATEDEIYKVLGKTPKVPTLRAETADPSNADQDYEELRKLSRFMKDTSNAGIPYSDWYWDGETLSIYSDDEAAEVEEYTKEDLIEIGVLESKIPSTDADLSNAETMREFYRELESLLNRTAGNSWNLDGSTSIDSDNDTETQVDIEISMRPPSEFFDEI